MRWRRALAQYWSAGRLHGAKPGALREVLGQFIKSAWQLDAVCDLFAEIAAGPLEEQTLTTADLLGRPAMDLETFTEQFAGVFAPAN